jgi:hypothetical protein
MNRWARVAAAAMLTVGIAACGAKVVVVPVPSETPETAPTVTTAPTAASENGSATDRTQKPQNTRAAASKLQGEGVFYALPRTVARIVVKADKVVTHSAPYARFAPIFAPGAEPPCGTIVKCAAVAGKGETTKYEIQQGATFTPFGEPDPSKVFMVKFTGGKAIDQTLSMAWNEAGLLSTASASVTNRTTDIVMSGLKLATGLATKALGSGSPDAAIPAAIPDDDLCNGNGKAENDKWVIPILSPPVPAAPKPDDPSKPPAKPLTTAPAESEPDAPKQGPVNPLVANYCELPAKDRPGREGEDSRDDYVEGRDREDLAQARRSYLVRVAPFVDQRSILLTSTTIQLLDPLKYVEKLETLIEQQVKELFVGSKSTKTWEIPFEVRTLQPGSPQPILGINQALGVCPKSELLAPDVKPAPSEFQVLSIDKCDKTATVSVAYHPGEERQLFSRIKAKVEESADDRSFRYILPAQVKATVAIGEQTYGIGVFAVAQLGHMVSLPAKRHAKTIAYDLAMIEATGGLKTFKLGTTGALDAGTIDALSAAGGTVLDARNARRKEEEAAQKDAATKADELTVLTRQHSLLKLKDEICELQKKYGFACTVQQ